MKELLKRTGLTKSELARRLGLNPRTVSAWGDEPPRYAVAYLEVYLEMLLWKERISESRNLAG